MVVAGTGSLLGGRELAGAVPVERESCWADVGATGRGHGLREGGCGLRLRCIDVVGIRTMNPGRGVPLGRSCGSPVLNFCALRFASRKAMFCLHKGGRFPR